MSFSIEKAPGELLEYSFDFDRWLQEGESIVSYVVDTPNATLTIEDIQIVDASLVIWLSMGEEGARYRFNAEVITNQGRHKEVTLVVAIGRTQGPLLGSYAALVNGWAEKIYGAAEHAGGIA